MEFCVGLVLGYQRTDYYYDKKDLIITHTD